MTERNHGPIDPRSVQVRRILACLDGSGLGEQGLPHAVALASALGAPLTLLRVLEPAPGEAGLPDPLAWELRRKEARDYLAREMAIAGAAHPDAAVESNLIEGKAAEEICRFGADHEVDLTVATTHGSGGQSAWILASTTRKLLDRVPGSLLIVPVKEEPPRGEVLYRRILVPLDGSPEAETALPLATRIAARHDAELLLSHVVPVAELTEIGPLDAEDLELLARVRKRNERVAGVYLDRIRSRLYEGAARVRAVLLRDGDVAARLSHAAESEHVDLVVMAAHGRGPRRSRACGSATANLIARLAIPLLIVRPHVPRAMRRVVAAEVRAPSLAAS
jgi:nucleotide-binding universal stress UspA family protein